MITQENIFFIRLVLLMIKVVAPVLKKVLTRKISDQDINTFFGIHEEKIRTLKDKGIIRQKEYDVVLPKCDLSKWDVTLLSCILLALFEDSFDAKEKNAIEKLREIKNETQSHHPTGSIGIKQYFSNVNRIRTLVTNLTLDFSRTDREDTNSSIDSVINDEIDIQRAIDEIKNHNATGEFMEAVADKVEQVFSSVSELTVTVNDCYNDVKSLKLSQEEIKQRLEEIASSRHNDVSTIIVGEVKLSGHNPEAVMKAAKKLLADAERALDPVTNANEPKTGIKRCLDDVRECGAEPKKVHLGSLVITMKCSTVQSVLNVMKYFHSLEIKQRLIEISRDLTVGENISLTASIPLATLRSALHDIDHVDSPVYHKTVRITTECHNGREAHDVWDIFEGEKATNKWNTLTEDLKSETGSDISLAASVDRNSLNEYFRKAECTTITDVDCQRVKRDSEYKETIGRCSSPTDSLLRFHLRRLEACSETTETERQYMQLVKYSNIFLSFFGKERIFLVGSTAEGLNLKRSENSGDADFLLCSGRVEIAIDNIEVLEDLSGHVRVRAENLASDCQDYAINGYLRGDILRDIRPELFTILRAIYLITTTTKDIKPGYEKRKTTTGVSELPFKSALARTEFRNLELGMDALTHGILNKRKKLSLLHQRNKTCQIVDINMSDINMLRKTVKLLKVVLVRGSKCEQFNHLPDVFDYILEQSMLKHHPQHISNEDSVVITPEMSLGPDLILKHSSYRDRKIKATYSDLTMKDFVPALRIIGDRKMNHLNEWKERVKKANWPPKSTVDEIYNLDVFLVAGHSSTGKESRQEFRLSFNLAEVKLCQCLSTVQRQLFLILKSYASGIMQRKPVEHGREIKLNTYFLKTALFWILERESPTLWKPENIIACNKAVLDFLLKCVQERKLPHYFMLSNLFFGLDDEDCVILGHCIQEILNDPIGCIGEFNISKQSRYTRGEIDLTFEEVTSMLEMNGDQNKFQNLHTIEDALIDIQRGLNESQRDACGKAPIREAILKVFETFLEEERSHETIRMASNISYGGERCQGKSQSTPVTDLPRTSFATGSVSQPMNIQQADTLLDILVSPGSLLPGGSGMIAKIGGRDGLWNILQQSTDQSVDHALELKTAIDKYLTCSNEEEECLVLELKQKLAAYFIGRYNNQTQQEPMKKL